MVSLDGWKAEMYEKGSSSAIRMGLCKRYLDERCTVYRWFRFLFLYFLYSIYRLSP